MGLEYNDDKLTIGDLVWVETHSVRTGQNWEEVSEVYLIPVFSDCLSVSFGIVRHTTVPSGPIGVFSVLLM